MYKCINLVVNTVYLLLFIININFDLYSQSLVPNNAGIAIKFIVMGHSYGVLSSFEKRDLLFNAINKEKPDYVFVLGDCDIYDEEVHCNFYVGGGDRFYWLR